MDDVVAKIVAQYKQWMVGATAPRTPILPKDAFEAVPDRNYNLKNRQAIKFLQHEKQTVGLNIGWTDNATNATGDRVARWFFTRKGDATTPVTYGEDVAIGYGRAPSFLCYESRTAGVNLGWHAAPSYEWKLLGGPVGTTVHTQEWLAIYNTKSEGGECLIYFDREVGGDVGWPSSDTWLDDLKGRAWEEVKRQAKKHLLP